MITLFICYNGNYSYAEIDRLYSCSEKTYLGIKKYFCYLSSPTIDFFSLF